MSGNRYFLDTNAIVQILSGNRDLLVLIADATYVATSVICELEFLSFSGLSEDDKLLFQDFIENIDVLDLCAGDVLLKRHILVLRREKKLKLPDAIIAASAMIHETVLVTADQHLLNLSGVRTLAYPVG